MTAGEIKSIFEYNLNKFIQLGSGEFKEFKQDFFIRQ